MCQAASIHGKLVQKSTYFVILLVIKTFVHIFTIFFIPASIHIEPVQTTVYINVFGTFLYFLAQVAIWLAIMEDIWSSVLEVIWLAVLEAIYTASLEGF